jgi:L-rhamnose-H+ transport protein
MHITGLLLIGLGGVMEGLFALPMKFTPKWSWENIWAAGSLSALILVPWPLALFTVPHLMSIYSSAPISAVLLAIVFGAGWGSCVAGFSENEKEKLFRTNAERIYRI